MTLQVSLRPIFFLTLLMIFATLRLSAGHVEESWAYNRQGMQKAALGNMEAAIRDFEQACRLNPFNDAALANLACARNNLGVMHSRNRNHTEAVRHFEAAIAQKPEDISIRLNLLSTLVILKNAAAVEKQVRQIIKLRPTDVEVALMAAAALQKTENHTEAISILQSVTEQVQDDPNLFAALGRIFYRQGNLSESRYYLPRSLDLSPDHEDAKRYLERVNREASLEQTTRSYTSLHFALSCHESFSEEWAFELLELLEDAYREVGDQLDFYPSQRSQVMIMQTDDFRRVHDLPDWAGGLYDGRIRLPVPSSATGIASLRGAVLHEYTHHVIFLKSAGNCPIWLNEGLAQIFEYGYEKTDRYAAAETGLWREHDEIDRLFKNSPEKQLAIELYRQSLSMSAQLIEDFGWQRMTEFLENIALGHDYPQASLDAFGETFEDIRQRRQTGKNHLVSNP